MPAITTNDGAQIYSKDWAKGRSLVFKQNGDLLM